MAHLEQLFISEGLPDRPYQTLDGRGVTYKAETATAEMREVKEMNYQYERDYFFDSSKFEEAFGWGATDPASGIHSVVKAG